MNEALRGRSYGPFVYEVGAEKIREFALAIHGSAPSSIYPMSPPESIPRAYFDGRVLAPPTFCATFAIKPFVASTLDPEGGINPAMIVHGEQELDFVEPVFAGDVLTTTGTITELYEKSGKEFVAVTTLTKNQHGRDVVRGVWTAVVRK